MQLTYRGAHYEYTPGGTKAARESNVFRALRPTFNLRYRGSVYAVDPNAEPSLPVSQPPAQLVYRGTAYSLNGWTKPVAAVQATSSVLSNTARFSKKASGKAEFATVHRSNLYNNLQRRLQVARDRGDQNLIDLLEQELQQIV
ncbi:DUF4278 domain-containing protein [Stenomitos frigidus]|uniref:DUF4278 domain-containing protein n=1 Tax=Stenomitos frigidus ULC18 TaxID=2107698 RepID=A0A2T1DYE8_9CYAN|nr:DUF4278 domain-containing protein [Stenomitos frigidus]PSB25505.1 hypothetical protein C7B82_23055 [Stenomitos frigidus ULC18]